MHNKSPKENMFDDSLHEIKDRLLLLAGVFAVILYCWKYLEKSPTPLNYIQGGLAVASLSSFYFFWLRPKLIKRRELNFKPTGEPDENYFTTAPRITDRYNFFSKGYEQFIDWLKNPKSPILYLSGRSGSGKSSLINAYIIPSLLKEKIISVRAYSNPLMEICKALNDEAANSSNINPERVLNQIKMQSELLPPTQNLIIILDQFEEFFILCNNESRLPLEKNAKVNELKRFFHLFKNNSPYNVHILISYRVDFQVFIDLLELPARTEHINYEEMKPLTFAQASKFLKSCPGLVIPELQLDSILKEATTIESRETVRPIVLNLLGIILTEMVSKKSVPKNQGNLIKEYILECLGKLMQERTAVLKAMLTNFKTAKPTTVQQLANETKKFNLSETELDNQMIRMQQYGLVRNIDVSESTKERKWQIAHDFVAEQLDKVVHGIHKTVWQKSKVWVAPILVSTLIVLTAFSLKSRDDLARNRSIRNIEKAGLEWTEETRTVSANNLDNLSNVSFQNLIPDLIVLKPDSLKIIYEPFKRKGGSYLLGGDVIEISELNGIEKLTSLKGLTVEYCREIEDYSPIGHLTNLVSLNLHYNHLKDLQPIANLTSLTNLDLESSFYLENIEQISNLTELRSVNLSASKCLMNMNSLKAIARLKKIQTLDLSLSGIQNVDALNSITTLKEIDLHSCQLLENIEGLKTMRNLSLVDLRNCSRITHEQAQKLQSAVGMQTVILSD